MIQKTIPLLPAINIPDTILFYENKLGFKTKNFGDYLAAAKDGCELDFVPTNDKYLCENSGTYIKVSNIEDLYIKLSALEIIQPKDKLVSKGRGKKEFCIRDNNGNLLNFGKNIPH